MRPFAHFRHHGRRRGYSLMELLVAMTIMIILGGGLVALLKQGITTWHIAEKRGGIYDRARMVLDRVAEDLRAAAGDSRAEGAGFWIRFLCDADRQGRPRLRFTRSISGESEDPIAREGGKYVETFVGSHYDLHGDAGDLEEGKLLAPAGYQEVVYAMDPDLERNLLWRGVRSPIGGAGSLFIDRNVEPEGEKTKPAPKKAPAGGGEAPESGVALAAPSLKSEVLDPGPLARAARPFSAGILHISFAFWTPFTETWDRTYPPRMKRSPVERSGPIITWDSTRAVLEDRTAPSLDFAWRRVEGSLEDPFDDIFPERVEVMLVVEGNADAPISSLVEDLTPSGKEVALSRTDGFPDEGPNRFIKIEGEWIGYDRVERGRLIVAPGKGAGRGARGTVPASHARGVPVDLGTTFRRVVEIPAVRMESPAPEEKRRRP